MHPREELGTLEYSISSFNLWLNTIFVENRRKMPKNIPICLVHKIGITVVCLVHKIGIAVVVVPGLLCHSVIVLFLLSQLLPEILLAQVDEVIEALDGVLGLLGSVLDLFGGVLDLFGGILDLFGSILELLGSVFDFLDGLVLLSEMNRNERMREKQKLPSLLLFPFPIVVMTS